MNYKLVGNYLGKVMVLLAAILALPVIIAIIYRDFEAIRAFLITIGILVLGGIPLARVKFDDHKLYAKEGLVVVAISWLALSFFGALPFYFSGEIKGLVNCIFESVSGFTTTGASIVPDVEVLSAGIIFWRSFTHWIGGMGVLIFLMAIVPTAAGERALNVMKAESPGPSPGKLVPRMRQSSKILYIIYLVMTLIETALLLFGGMSFLDSIVIAMGTAGTGGFSPINGTMALYNSAFCDGVITVFMILFGVNFTIYHLLLLRKFAGALRNEEWVTYLGIIATSTVLITINLTASSVYETAGEAFRYAVFQVASFMTTTGYASIGFGNWHAFSKNILFMLMFVGGCAGSTAGGIKVSRINIMIKECRRTIGQIVRPRAVEVVKFDGKPVEKSITQSVCQYGIVCALLFFATVFVLTLENLDMESTFSVAATAINNVGAGFGIIAPGGAGLGGLSALSKLTMSMSMLLGRLEFYPIMILFAPRTWKRV
ncbi:MAG: TrkH family potassium uptake protein [Oscillospiraceae bacterium]|jgi:trk system potassium uptake protein TrkH|nr:TrkH family potassium uptake protein [Oscillospiraceae bacterium]